MMLSAWSRAAAWSVSLPSEPSLRRNRSTHRLSDSRSWAVCTPVSGHTMSTADCPGPLELPKPTTDTCERGDSSLSAMSWAAARSRATSAPDRLPDSSTRITTRTGLTSSAGGAACAAGTGAAAAVTTATVRDAVSVKRDLRDGVTRTFPHRFRFLIR